MTKPLSSIDTDVQIVQRERDQLRALLDQAPALVCSLQGPEHVYAYVNPIYQQVIGRHRDVLGKPIREALPELDGQGFYELLDQVYATGEAYHGTEARVMLDRHDDGRLDEAYIDFIYQAIVDVDGSITGILVHGVEVTERVKARLVRQAQEQRIGQYEQLLEGSGWGVAIGDPDGHCLLDVNEAFAAMHGYSVAEMRGIDSNLIFAPEHRPNKLADYVPTTNARGRYQYESLHQRKDGSTFWCLTDVIAVKDETGRIVYRIGTFQDLTERYEREQHLKDLNATLAAQGAELERLYREQRAYTEEVEAEVARRTEELVAANREMAEHRALTERIIENAPAGIAFLDGDLVYRRLNRAYAHLMDMDVEQVLDRSIHEVFPGATDQFEPLMRQVMATGVPYVGNSFPFRFMLDGQEKITYWDFTYQPVLDAEGRVGILILEVEVSDRMERERLHQEQIAQLKAMDRYKDQFLSVISHELRTPLNFITGFASLLEDEVPGPLNHPQREAVARILNGSDRMLKLVDDLLDVAKLQSERFELAPEPTAYAALVEEVVGLLRPLIDQRGLAVTAEVALVDPVRLDPARVSQVLTNLVSNAIKFTDAGGRLSIRARVDGDALLTEVTDTGIGIAEDDLGRVFNRFEQLDMSNTRKAGGTGLGLAIAKGLVEAHGGTIGVKSTLGEGSTFWFRLPLGAS